jgi:hypothetical protein
MKNSIHLRRNLFYDASVFYDTAQDVCVGLFEEYEKEKNVLLTTQCLGLFARFRLTFLGRMMMKNLRDLTNFLRKAIFPDFSLSR